MRAPLHGSTGATVAAGRADDEAALDAWLNEDPVHRIAYWRMEAAWERTQRLAALHLPKAQQRKGPPFFRIAAVLALVAAAAPASGPILARPQGATYTTSIGGRETIMLADGTQIELNTDSAVRVLDTTAERKVWLEKGEAYFQVTHDATAPLDRVCRRAARHRSGNANSMCVRKPAVSRSPWSRAACASMRTRRATQVPSCCRKAMWRSPRRIEMSMTRKSARELSRGTELAPRRAGVRQHPDLPRPAHSSIATTRRSIVGCETTQSAACRSPARCRQPIRWNFCAWCKRCLACTSRG